MQGTNKHTESVNIALAPYSLNFIIPFAIVKINCSFCDMRNTEE